MQKIHYGKENLEIYSQQKFPQIKIQKCIS